MEKFFENINNELALSNRSNAEFIVGDLGAYLIIKRKRLNSISESVFLNFFQEMMRSRSSHDSMQSLPPSIVEKNLKKSSRDNNQQLSNINPEKKLINTNPNQENLPMADMVNPYAMNPSKIEEMISKQSFVVNSKNSKESLSKNDNYYKSFSSSFSNDKNLNSDEKKKKGILSKNKNFYKDKISDKKEKSSIFSNSLFKRKVFRANSTPSRYPSAYEDLSGKNNEKKNEPNQDSKNNFESNKGKGNNFRRRFSEYEEIITEDKISIKIDRKIKRRIRYPSSDYRFSSEYYSDSSSSRRDLNNQEQSSSFQNKDQKYADSLQIIPEENQEKSYNDEENQEKSYKDKEN